MEIIERGGEDVTVACTIDGAKLSWKIGHVKPLILEGAIQEKMTNW